MIVGYVGLTHLGLVMAASASTIGDQDVVEKIVCFDDDEELISNLREGRIPLYEPALKSIIQTNHQKFQFTSDNSELSQCDLIFVTVDVEDHSDLHGVNAFTSIVVSNAKSGASIVIVSQVPPGYTRGLADKYPQFIIYYQLDNLVFGESIKRVASDLPVVIGYTRNNPSYIMPSIDNKYQKFLFSLKRRYTVLPCQEVEFAKMAINCYLVSSIAITNSLADSCVASGVDWEIVSSILKSDDRIGKKAYLQPSLNLGGGHMLRDVESMSKINTGHVEKCFIEAHANSNWSFNTIDKYEDYVNNVAIWGLAYKNGTDSIVDSPGVDLFWQLTHNMDRINVHDPVVKTFKPKHQKYNFYEDCLNCIMDCDLLAVMTPWNQYRYIDLNDIYSAMVGRSEKPILIDPFRVFTAGRARSLGFGYETLGLGR